MMQVLKMTDELFTQRRRVITQLYAARKVIGKELPRIKVRIVKFDSRSTLGVCFIDKDFISISSDLTQWNDEKLRFIVWHELGHAYFRASHDENCVLMRSTLPVKLPSLAMLEKALKKLSQN